MQMWANVDRGSTMFDGRTAEFQFEMLHSKRPPTLRRTLELGEAPHG